MDNKKSPDDTKSYGFIETPTNVIKCNILYYKKEISLSLVLLCLFIVIYTYQGFNDNQKHDGAPALLISIVSYITTTTALTTALLFL
jgi:hypothetical protein